MTYYEYHEGSFTVCQDIIDHADSHKENVNCPPLGHSSLGLIVQDAWDGNVTKARRGPRNYQQTVYLNMQKKPSSRISPLVEITNTLMDELCDLVIPQEWKMVQNNQHCICFVRMEKWEFNKVRASTEIVVTRPENSPNAIITIRAHGCERDISDVAGIQSLPIKERVGIVINYVEKSSFCSGISLLVGESLQVFVPHVNGTFRDLEQGTTAEEESKAYSLKCKVFSPPDSKCPECRHLLKLHQSKVKRRQKREGIHTKCNKRYLSKEEVVLQLHHERKRRLNAEKREKYWKDKFNDESIEIESGDNDDLTSMFQGLSKENVPEEMACLWDQQQRIINTASKRGYRWHPK